VTTATIDRTIAIEVAYNVRHIGGYLTRDGRRTSEGIIRAASLHNLTPGGVGTLAALGVQTVVDLRSAEERRLMPTPALGAAIAHVTAAVIDIDASPAAFAENFVGYAPIYERFLETGRDAYRSLFATVAASDGGVLFHCAAGKDRTGVAAALLLEIAGVADDDIVADYSCSERLLQDAFKDWKPTEEQRARAETLDAETRAKLLLSEPEYIASTLGYVRQRWGSAAGYMSHAGLDDATISRLRERLLA
jgi:protein-tyrosine phosphatase